MDVQTQKDLHVLANSFAEERLSEEKAKLYKSLSDAEDGVGNIAIEKELGRILATAYAKGFADGHDRVGPRTLIF